MVVNFRPAAAPPKYIEGRDCNCTHMGRWWYRDRRQLRAYYYHTGTDRTQTDREIDGWTDR